MKKSLLKMSIKIMKKTTIFFKMIALQAKIGKQEKIRLIGKNWFLQHNFSKETSLNLKGGFPIFHYLDYTSIDKFKYK